jgi:antitoxin component of MazEF toxin-antitoxin module
MTITLKENIGLVVPPSVQRQAGIKAGDRVKFKVTRSVITITATAAKAVAPIEAEDEYTPAQRRS